MIITAIVEERRISRVDVDGTPVGGVGVDSMRIQLDQSWDGFDHYAVWFDNDLHPEPVMFAPTAGRIAEIDELPPMKAGYLRLTVDAWNNGGDHQLTERMRSGIRISRHGAHNFGSVEPAAQGTLQKLIASAEKADAATARSVTQMAAMDDSENRRTALFEESQARRDDSFAASQLARSKTFDANMSAWDAQVDASSKAAEDIAAEVRRKLDRGELNGPGFQIKYERASLTEIQAIADASEGDVAIVMGADKHAEQYGQTYVYGHDGQWHESVDMSVAGETVVGPKGDKGVSVSGATISGSNLVIQTTDPSTGATTEHDAGSLVDVAAPIVTAQLDSRILVMDKSEYDALTEYATGVVYLVRQ